MPLQDHCCFAKHSAMQRQVEILVLSDIHLGTYGCHARELLQYLKTIRPKMVVLNGDIIDIWQFSKRYFPAGHMQVVRHLLKWVAEEIPVYYIPGNHDEMLRKFKDFQLGSLTITNKLTLNLGEEKVWIFHGDVFDVVMEHSRWLAKLGAIGYDTLILINRAANFLSKRMKGRELSFSRKIKNSVKGAVKFINQFENTVTNIAAENNYRYVVCGHIHQPEIRTMATRFGPVVYMNSGDWIENLSALEFDDGNWRIYQYREDPVAQEIELGPDSRHKESAKELLQTLLAEMKLKQD